MVIIYLINSKMEKDSEVQNDINEIKEPTADVQFFN
jgi:hypothetical protein